MARRGQPAPEPDDLSVHELIDGPTEILSQDTLDAIRGPAASGHDLSLEETHDLSASAAEATRDLSGGGPAGTGARERVELPRMPAAGALYRRALLGALPGLGGGRRSAGLPAVELAVGGIAVDRTHLADYDRVCGFRLTDRLPATFPHVMGFPLALRLMTAPEFPIPLTGVVHVGNRITVHRPVTADETLDFRAYAENLRPHDRGRQVDVVLVGSVDGAEVWRGVSTYLGREGKRGGGGRREQAGRPTTPAGSARWRVDPRVGTDYARVSGDHNPIHTSRLGARLFGFPGRSRTGCGARPVAWPRWRTGCRTPTRSRWPSSCPCRCRAR